MVKKVLNGKMVVSLEKDDDLTRSHRCVIEFVNGEYILVNDEGDGTGIASLSESQMLELFFTNEVIVGNLNLRFLEGE